MLFVLILPSRSFTNSIASFLALLSDLGATAIAAVSNGTISAINVTNPGTGYKDVTVVITGDGSDATATATLINDIDKVESYGDNNSFKREAESFIFNDRNPFGEVDPD